MLRKFLSLVGVLYAGVSFAQSPEPIKPFVAAFAASTKAPQLWTFVDYGDAQPTPDRVRTVSYDGYKTVRLELEKSLKFCGLRVNPTVVWVIADKNEDARNFYDSMATGETRKYNFEPEVAEKFRVSKRRVFQYAPPCHEKKVSEDERTYQRNLYYLPLSYLSDDSSAKANMSLATILKQVEELQKRIDSGDVYLLN